VTDREIHVRTCSLGSLVLSWFGRDVIGGDMMGRDVIDSYVFGRDTTDRKTYIRAPRHVDANWFG
jgi:hypothetical protein